MKMYFSLQTKRIIRNIEQFGINAWLGIVLAAVAFAVLSLLLYSRVALPQYIYPLFTIPAVYSLGRLRRNEFLQNIFTYKGYRQVRLLENLLVAIPFCIFLLLKQQYISALAALAAAALCSLYNKVDRSGLVIPTPFGKRPFEFTIGVRKNWWLLLLFYIITGIAISVNNFNLGITAFVGTWLLGMSFYSKAEPLFYVWVHAQTPARFLQQKIKTSIIYSLCMSLPLAIALTVFYPANVLIILLVVVIGLLYVTMGVAGKYAIYPQEIQMIHVIKMIAGMICPPLLLVIIPHFYNRAIKTLNPWLR